MKVLKTLAVLSMVFTLAACKTAPEAEKKADTPVVPADPAAAFQDAIKGKLMDITTAGGATMVMNADGKTITFDADGSTTTIAPLDLTFVSAKSAAEATYSDKATPTAKEAVVTLTDAGGKLAYDAKDYDFVFKVAKTDFTGSILNKTFIDDAATDKSTLVLDGTEGDLTYTVNGGAAVTLNFVRATSATAAAYVNSADATKAATVTIAGTKLTLVYDAKTITYTIS